MKTSKILLHVVALILSLVSLQGISQKQDLTAKDVVEKADDNMRGNTSEANISIQIIRPSWSRKMNMKTWSKGDNYSMIMITSPAKEKGIVFLKRIKEIGYLPLNVRSNFRLQ